MANLINWFEIPATDINRASEFYKKVLGGDLQQQEMMGIKWHFYLWMERVSVELSVKVKAMCPLSK